MYIISRAPNWYLRNWIHGKAYWTHYRVEAFQFDVRNNARRVASHVQGHVERGNPV